MTSILTQGPIKIAYDEPATGTREGFGAKSAMIVTLGEPEPDNPSPSNCHMMVKSAEQAALLLATAIASIGRNFGHDTVTTAIASAIVLEKSKSAFRDERRIDSDPQPPQEGRTN